MGHAFDCWRKVSAQPVHRHMCRHGSSTMRRASVRQMTHSRPLSLPSFSSPNTSCTRYDRSSRMSFCLSGLMLSVPSSPADSDAYVSCAVTRGDADAPSFGAGTLRNPADWTMMTTG
eukprot:TRINITY_DN7960_c0_g1_i1.p1 TRINITY_DN7960_c0_g1~~TRINITY_DN7960_c0_g1_i1.p1  ORF type:complete len:117 (+),score=13.11 TRINITY_DN7960_c0_g1_i1:387-737(+)